MGETPSKTKYAFKPPLMEATYTKLRKICEKKWHYKNEKKQLLFVKVFSGYFWYFEKLLVAQATPWFEWVNKKGWQINFGDAFMTRWYPTQTDIC